MVLSKKPRDEVAELIELTNLCKTLRVLPRAGGVLDQPADLIDGLVMVLIAQNEREELEQKKNQRQTNAVRSHRRRR